MKAAVNFNLVMEDLSKLQPGDQVKGCSPEQALLVAEAFASLHSLHWQDQSLGQQSWVLNRVQQADIFASLYSKGARVFRERFQGRLSEENFAIIDQLEPIVAACNAWLSPVNTLIHGEPRVDNVIFEMSLLPKAYLIDWQFADYGNPMFDLAYFTSGSLTPSDRQACERSMIALHNKATATIDSTYTLQQAEQDYAFSLVFGLMTTITAGISVPEGDEEDKLLLTLATRNCAAMADWNSLVVARERVDTE